MRRTLRLILSLALFAVALPAAASAAARQLQMVGGSDVAQGQLPFLAKVEASASGLLYSCTGTVIAPDAILTAGHCAYDAFDAPLPASAYTVTIGSSVISPLSAQAPGVERLAVAAVIPYRPMASSLHGDATVLLLSTPTSAPAVRLATAAEVGLYRATTPITIAGWGKTTDSGTPSPVLHQGTQAIEANGTCLSANRFFDPRFQLCAESQGDVTGICSGDSGGPALVSTPTGWVEVGVVSYLVGHRCGHGPDYYARVATLQAWIASQVARSAPRPAAAPTYAPPTGVRLRGTSRRLAVSFTAPPADPTALVSSYLVALRTSAGRTVATRVLHRARTVSITGLAAGTYAVTVIARYAAGPNVAAPGVSGAVFASTTRRVTRPRIVGFGRPGFVLRCSTASSRSAGGQDVRRTWLRNGRRLHARGATYRVRRRDAGARIACRTVVKTTAGGRVTATSFSVRVVGRP